jgi:hypothetical protein
MRGFEIVRTDDRVFTIAPRRPNRDEPGIGVRHTSDTRLGFVDAPYWPISDAQVSRPNVHYAHIANRQRAAPKARNAVRGRP